MFLIGLAIFAIVSIFPLSSAYSTSVDQLNRTSRSHTYYQKNFMPRENSVYPIHTSLVALTHCKIVQIINTIKENFIKIVASNDLWKNRVTLKI